MVNLPRMSVRSVRDTLFTVTQMCAKNRNLLALVFAQWHPASALQEVLQQEVLFQQALACGSSSQQPALALQGQQQEHQQQQQQQQIEQQHSPHPQSAAAVCVPVPEAEDLKGQLQQLTAALLLRSLGAVREAAGQGRGSHHCDDAGSKTVSKTAGQSSESQCDGAERDGLRGGEASRAAEEGSPPLLLFSDQSARQNWSNFARRLVDALQTMNLPPFSQPQVSPFSH